MTHGQTMEPLEFTRGSTFSFLIYVERRQTPTSAMSAYDLTGSSIMLRARHTPWDPSFVFERVIGDGITLLNQTTFPGWCRVTINPSHTSSLPNREHVLYFDADVGTVNDGVFTTPPGFLTVRPEIT